MPGTQGWEWCLFPTDRLEEKTNKQTNLIIHREEIEYSLGVGELVSPGLSNALGHFADPESKTGNEHTVSR